MPKTGLQFITELATKAGIASDNADLKTLLALPELAAIQVPDTVVTAMEGNLLSLDAAKNNHPDIKRVYTAAAYDGIDRRLIEVLGTDTFDAADLEEIKTEKNTTKKCELIITKLKAAKASAKGADKEEINRQLQAAHDAAKLAKEEKDKLKGEYEAKINEIQMKAAMKAIFSNYKTIYDELPSAAKAAAMEALVTTALQDKKAEFKTDEHGNLTLIGKDGANVFGENHVQLTPQKLFDTTFAPILKNSGPPKPVLKTNGTHTTTPVKVDEGAEAIVSSISDHNAKVIEQMSKPAASLI